LPSRATQSAALFGQTCFSEGDTKNTYGTGCFTLMNTGAKRVRSENGLVSSVAWSIHGNLAYALEGSVFNAGAAISWLRDGLGIITTPRECDELAETLTDNEGVYLVPAFTGLGAPYWDMYARGSIIGLTRGTGRAHIARAALESIAYQVKDLVELMQKESTHQIRELRVDGGASVSDFLMQFQADILGIPVNRGRHGRNDVPRRCQSGRNDMRDLDFARSVKSLRKSDAIYVPHMEEVRRERYYEQWKRAVIRSGKWIGSDQ
jgi:glycerol kinase